MSCNNCTRNVLRSFLGHFDIVIPPTRIAGGGARLSFSSYSRGSHSLATRDLTQWIQQRRFQTESKASCSSATTEQKSTLPFTEKRKSGYDNGGFSGIGHVGQQSKDLQEHVSSIAAVSEGALRSTKSAQKKSVSTPARLARRERRMPSRRFKGDRARPQTKDRTPAEAASKGKEKKSQGGSLATTWRKVNSPLKTNEGRSFARKTEGARSPRESWKAQKNGLEKGSDRPRWATASKRETSLPRNTSEEMNIVSETEKARPGMEPWGIQKKALEKKFGEQGWTPRKRLSPDALEGIRTLHAQLPETYTTPVLAEHFKVSPENIRRILKSKWRPNEEEDEDRRRRWEKRGEGIWTDMAAKGVKPPKPWREKGIGKLSNLRRSNPNFVALEEQIGMECAKDVITTRIASGQETHGSLANTIL